MRYDSSRYLVETTCPAEAEMILQLKLAVNDEELVATCQTAMGCDDLDLNFCSTFMGPEEPSSNARRLLSFDHDMQLQVASEHFKSKGEL